MSYTLKEITKTVDVPITVVEKSLMPQSELTLNVSSDKAVAQSYWYITYQENAINITVKVLDNNIKTASNIYNSDGVEFILNSVAKIKGYSEGETLKVIASNNGILLIKRFENGIFSNLDNSGITINTDTFSTNGLSYNGYSIDISVPYSAMGLDTVDNNLAICIGLTNANNSQITTNYNKDFETSYEDVHTYIAITDDNTFEKNKYLQLGYNFGNAGYLKATDVWNVDNDNETENANISMNSVSGDNNIYMYRTGAANLYAYAKINAVSVQNGEKWGKFGLTVTTEDGNGFMFYVDASGNGTTMTGTGLGYVSKVNNAWAGNWTGLAGNTGSYQGTDYIELAVYRQGSVFVLYANGQKITSLSGFSDITNETKAYVGIASFNIMLKVKEYGITDNAEDLTDKLIQQVEIDYLFMGDSYVDTAFWNGYNQEFNNYSSANVGIGGTKVQKWIDMFDVIKLQYNPSNIIVHIGINDINDNNSSYQNVITLLNTMFEKYKTAFPDVSIYYISLNPNNFKPDKWSICQQINTDVTRIASDDNKINFINLAQYIGTEAGARVAGFYGPDGLHFNSNGYALWTREILKALNLTREDSAQLGDNNKYAYSSGWSINGDTAENTGTLEQQIYFSDINNVSFFAQIDISVLSKTVSTDNYPKIGLFMKSATKTAYYFIDATTFTNNWGNMVVRQDGGDWDWSCVFSSYKYLRAQSYNNSFKTLAILKTGNAIYCFADGNAVMYVTDLFNENETISVGVMDFNLQAQIKNPIAITEATAIETKMEELGIGEQSEITLNGDLSDWTAQQLSNPIIIPASNGRSVKIYANKSNDGVYIAYDVFHSKYVTNAAEWFNNTNIEFRLGDGGQRAACASWQSRWEDGGSRDIGDAFFNSIQLATDLYHTIVEIFIPYVMIDGYDANSDYIPAGFAWKTPTETGNVWDNNSDYWFSPEADPNMRNIQITENGLNYSADLAIDGDSSDWNSSILATEKTIATTATTTIKGVGFKGTDGVYLLITINAPELRLNYNSLNWWENTNFELKVGPEESYGKLIFFNNDLCFSGRIGSAAYSIEGDNQTGYILKIEVFIPYENIAGTTASSESVNVKLGCVVTSWITTSWWDTAVVFNSNGVQ
jgi:lysophospholipase L1-like esterase